VRTRTFVILALLASLLVAGGVSYYASSHPDGLEYVAEKVGFGDAAEEHANADGPLADYQVRGVDDERLSGGLAGIIGALVVLVITGGLGYLLRRRGGPDPHRPDPHETDPHETDADRVVPAGPADVGHVEGASGRG
jgi:cobalt/nickel transport protein